MPISKENKARYPHNWNEIRAAILIECDNKCELCGVQNYDEGYRDETGNFHPVAKENQYLAREAGKHIIRIILTIMHLDHIPENCDRKNLKAGCQRCHNRYDQEHRKANRVRSAISRRIETSSGELA